MQRACGYVVRVGLDVYAGSLTRYFSGDWETVVQQFGREQGIRVEVVRANEPEDAVTDPEEVRALVDEWRTALAEAVGMPFVWEESADGPYFTDKPDWVGYANLQVLAALDERGDRKRPKDAVDNWTKVRAWKKAARGSSPRYAHLYRPELWLPIDLPVIEAPAPTGDVVAIGSTDRLLEELRELNERTYRLGSGARREIDPSGGGFEEAAQFGLAIFLVLAEQATEHRLPMKLDY